MVTKTLNTTNKSKESDTKAEKLSEIGNSAAYIPFTLDNMVELLTAYEAYYKLEEVLNSIALVDPCSGLLGQIRHIDYVLQDLSPLFDPKIDYEFQEFSRILEDEHMDIREKARLLMGGSKYNSISDPSVSSQS